jgi:hypothetical protein
MAKPAQENALARQREQARILLTTLHPMSILIQLPDD